MSIPEVIGHSPQPTTRRRPSPLPRRAHGDDVTLDEFVLHPVTDKKLGPLDISNSITAGEIVLSIEQASSLAVTLFDPDLDLLRSGYLDTEDDELKLIQVDFDEWVWRLVKVNKAGDYLNLTFEERAVNLLKKYKTPLKATRGDGKKQVTRAEFILKMVREVKHVIPVRIFELHKEQPIEGLSEQGRDPDEKPRRGFEDGVKLWGKSESAPFKDYQLRNATKALAVADEEEAPELAQLALIVACIVEAPDFKNPTGGDGTSAGILQLIDTWYGGSVEERRNIERVVGDFLKRGFTGKGGAIKLAKQNPGWSPADVATAVQGNRDGASSYAPYEGEARRILDAWGGAGASLRYKKYEFKRDRGESTWDCSGRLAEEVGWRRYVVKGVFYYWPEEELYKARASYIIEHGTDGVDPPDFDYDEGKPVKTVSLTARIDRWSFRPGRTVRIRDYGTINGKWLVAESRRDIFDAAASITLRKPTKERLEPKPEAKAFSPQGGSGTWDGTLTTEGGAKGIVDQIAALAMEVGGEGVYVGSSYRPGDTVESGAPSDHSSNDASRAARDIGVRGIDLLVGPPSPKLDKAIIAIGEALGRHYDSGKSGPFQNADNIYWKGYRIQLIWRTPRWGGHMGHIHVGCRTA